MGRIISHRESAERYTALRFIGVIFTGLGAVFLAVASLLLVFGLYALFAGGTVQPTTGEVPFSIAARPQNVAPFAGFWGGALSAVWSLGFLISGLQFLAMGALFRLLIHVEENTRISAQSLEQLRSRTDPIEQNVGLFFRS